MQSYGSETIVILFEKQVKKTPNQVAIRFDDHALTYNELNAQANQLAHYLREAGIGREDIVAIYMERSIHMVVAMIAVLKAGAAYLPLEPLYPPDYLHSIVSDAQPKMLLTQEALKKTALFLLENKEAVYSLDSGENKLNTYPTENPVAINHSQDLMYVMYTSGTTGKPKGVMLEHQQAIHLFENMKSLFDLNSDDRWPLLHSCAFDVSVGEVWGALLHGVQLVVMPQSVSSDPKKVYEFLVEQKITLLSQTPSAFHLLRQVDITQDTKLKLRYIFFTGEPLWVHALKDWMKKYGDEQPKLINMYGITETTVYIMYRWIQVSDVNNPKVVLPIGKALPGHKLYVLDEEQKPLTEVGSLGELYISGTQVGRGYLNKPELTQERFISSLQTSSQSPTEKPEILYRTGDLVRILENEELEYVARNDEQVKVRGFRIELSHIEHILSQYDGIKQCVVIAKSDNDNTKNLLAYLVLTKEATFDVNHLKNYLSQKLPQQVIPAIFIKVDSLPRNINGKINKKALPAPSKDNLLVDSPFIPPRDAREKAVCEIMQQVLSHAQIGIKHNFFFLGGHSLAAAEIASRISQLLDIRCEGHEVLANPTIEKLLNHLDHKKINNSELTHNRARKKDALLPQSFAQKRLWVAHQTLRNQQPAGYNVKFALHFHGKVDTATLTRALQALVNRHEGLRTFFPFTGSQCVADITVNVEHATLDAGCAHPQRAVESLMDTLCKKDFGDLSQAPLFKFLLIEMSKEQYVLAMVFHHIIIDGLSIPVLLKDLSALYNHEACEPLNIHYSDYAHWEQKLFLQGDYNKGLAYWKKELTGATAMLTLPTDKTRSEKRTYEAKSHFFYFPATMVNALQAFASEQQVTLFTLLLSSIGALLYRYTQQEDFNIGIPCGERTHSTLTPLVGFFVNMLPIRFQKMDMSFIALLQNTHNILLAAYENNVPLEEIIDELKLPQFMNNHPLFQISVTMHNTLNFALDFNALKTTLWDESLISSSEMQAAKFELSFEMEVLTDGQLAAKIEYATELYNTDSIERMAYFWKKLCEEILQNPSAMLSSLPLLTEVEKNDLMSQWSSRPTSNPLSNVLEVFDEQVKRTPQRIAVVDENVSLTYKELNERANQLAHHLCGIHTLSNSENIIAVAMERSVDYIVSILAVLKTGSAYLPLDPELPVARLQYMLQDAKSKIVITKNNYEQFFTEMFINCIFLDDENTEAILLKQLTHNPSRTTKPNHLAYVIYTSGSTGNPKGVMIEHNSIVQLVKNTNYVQIGLEDRIAQIATALFDAYTFEVWGALLNGASVFVCPKTMLLDTSEFKKFVLKNGITILFITTALFYRFLQTIPEVFSNIKNVLFGGESLPIEEALAAAFKNGIKKPEHLVHVYGPTENTTFSTAYEVNSQIPVNTRLPIGYPIQTTDAYIFDKHYQPVPVGMIGELYLAGAGLARGYLQQSQLTEQKFVSYNLSPHNSIRLYKTGDRVCYRSDGSIVFIGRDDQQVKLAGYRIELSEIERAILLCSKISEVVVTKCVFEGKQLIVAYCTTKEAINANQAEFKLFLHKELTKVLPHYMLPSAIMLLDKLPLSENGKLDHNQLPKPVFESQREYIQPSTKTEELISQLWKETLSTNNEMSIKDNFFMVGGSSLLAMRLTHRINQELGTISYTALFTEPTIEAQAKLMDMAEGDRQKSILSIDYFKQEAILDEDIKLQDTSDFLYPENPRTVLLTGVTGFLGVFLLEELLATTSATIYCIIRAKDATHAQERFNNTLKKYQLENLVKQMPRIKLLVADIVKPYFDLPITEYKKLCIEVDIIYHSASEVNFVKPYSALKKTNVDGTKNMLRFAVAKKTKPLQYISTAAVFSFSHYFSKKSFLLEENVEWNDTIAKSLPSDLGYVQSKAVAEKLIWQAKDRNIPVSIYRLGFMLCHGKTGVTNMDQLWGSFLKDCVNIGSFPDFYDLREEFVTVDYASKAIVNIAQQSASLAQVFHIVPSKQNNITTNGLFDMLAKKCYFLHKKSFYHWREDWLRYIRENPYESNLRLLAPLFTDFAWDKLTLFEVYQQSPTFDNSNTLSLLEPKGIVEEPFNPAVIKKCLMYIMPELFSSTTQLSKNTQNMFADTPEE